MTGVTMRVDFEGPFFTRDPRQTVRSNIRDMMDALAAEMERDVRAQIEGQAGAMPFWTGWTLNRVQGRTSSLAGRRWQVTAVVSAHTGGMGAKAAIRTKAAAAGIERRWHPFRRTTATARRARAVIAANLTRGLE